MSYSDILLSLPKTSSIPLSSERPLWSAFDAFYAKVTGYHAVDFQFMPGKTPMATGWETASVLCSYYFIIFVGREMMRGRPAFSLNGLFKIHNLLLTVASGGMLALFAEQLIPSVANDGLFRGICGNNGWTKPLVTLYYMNYITKYIELIDTLFLVLKKKPLTFLHTYHHGATALLCYTQLVGHTPVSWVPITANLFVHVVMYWYYFQAARGIKIWWKQWITIFQILQFVIDLGFIYFATYSYFASAHAPWLPHIGTCQGEFFAAVTGCVILSSYLLLFLSFYASTYRKKPAQPTKLQAKDAIAKLEQTEIPSEKNIEDLAKTAIVKTTGHQLNGYANTNGHAYTNGNAHKPHMNGHMNGKC